MIYQRKTRRALWTQLPSALKEAADTQTARQERRQKRIASKSAEQMRRDRLYAPLVKWFKQQRPWCEACAKLPLYAQGHWPCEAHSTEDIHHPRGKVSALLFYFPLFVPTCRAAHTWIENNKQAARDCGLECSLGDWNKQPTESVWRASWRGGYTYLVAKTEAEAAAQLPACTPTFKLTLIE